jgi:hypothetical protein
MVVVLAGLELVSYNDHYNIFSADGQPQFYGFFLA